MTHSAEPRRRGRPPSGGREAILEAALAVVREEGVAKLTSREVAARAGVSDASVYYHFGDREGLLRSVLAHGLKPLEFLDQPAQPPMAIGDLLAAALASLEQFFDEALPVLAAALSEVKLGRALAEYIEANRLGPHRGVDALGSYLRAEQAAGRVNPDADAEVVAMMVIDVAFARSWRRHALWLDDSDDRLPAPERMLATLERILEPPPA